MSEPSDTYLINRIREGNIGAFEILVKRYQRVLMRFAYRILRDPHASEEVAQDTLFAVYQAIDRIDPSKRFSTYLFTIARNRSISYIRKRKPEVSIDKVELSVDAKLYEAVSRQEKVILIRQCMNKLPTKYRRILEYYYIADLSYASIAERMKLPLNTVRTHLRRAKHLLKNHIPYEAIS